MYKEKIEQSRRQKSNLENKHTSKSKTSNGFPKAENELTELSCGPDSTQGAKAF